MLIHHLICFYVAALLSIKTGNQTSVNSNFHPLLFPTPNASWSPFNPPRVMGTLGYCAPEYQRTGRRAVDLTRKTEELHLVRCAETRLKDPKKYSELVDPLLDGHYPRASLSQVLAIAAMCLSTDASVRPSISDVVDALDSPVQDPIP
ncbi:putative non-specific serine/threonine protein kinase [Helianthus anomalus]